MNPMAPGRRETLLVEPGEIPTVLLVGAGSLGRAANFLRLGAVAVVAPDRNALQQWQGQVGVVRAEDAAPLNQQEALEVDLRGHAIRWQGEVLRLTEREYRILAALAIDPGRAWSFQELRAAGSGPASPARGDVVSVRSIVQRLRSKLRVARVRVQIPSIRGLGYRLTIQPPAPRSVPDQGRSKLMRN